MNKAALWVVVALLGFFLMMSLGLMWVSNTSHADEVESLGKRLDKTIDKKVTFCDGARVTTVSTLYALRHPETLDSGVFAAQQLGLTMRYCDGDRGAALAREIEDAIMDALPARYGGTRTEVDVKRIEQALLTFKGRP